MTPRDILALPRDHNPHAEPEPQATAPPTAAITLAPDDLPTLDQLADELFRDEPADARSDDETPQPGDALDAAPTASDSAAIELIAARGELRRLTIELRASFAEKRRVEGERLSLAEQHAHLRSDFDNFRRRAERERADNQQAAVGEVVRRLLPLADNFRRAREVGEASVNLDEFRQFAVGVRLIGEQLDDVLASYGVEPIAAVGELFDPHVHEAIAVEPVEGCAANTIFEEVVRGYRLGEMLLRPALVKVAAAA